MSKDNVIQWGKATHTKDVYKWAKTKTPRAWNHMFYLFKHRLEYEKSARRPDKIEIVNYWHRLIAVVKLLQENECWDFTNRMPIKLPIKTMKKGGIK